VTEDTAIELVVFNTENMFIESAEIAEIVIFIEFKLPKACIEHV